MSLKDASPAQNSPASHHQRCGTKRPLSKWEKECACVLRECVCACFLHASLTTAAYERGLVPEEQSERVFANSEGETYPLFPPHWQPNSSPLYLSITSLDPSPPHHTRPLRHIFIPTFPTFSPLVPCVFCSLFNGLISGFHHLPTLVELPV